MWGHYVWKYTVEASEFTRLTLNFRPEQTREFSMPKNNIGSLRFALICSMCLNLVTLGCIPAAQAEVIGTPVFSQSMTRDARIDRINSFIAQDSVRQQMQSLGVDPRDAQARVAALTDSELQALDQHIASAPAGGDFLAVIGIVFIVLLILELTGVIHIFQKF